MFRIRCIWLVSSIVLAIGCGDNESNPPKPDAAVARGDDGSVIRRDVMADIGQDAAPVIDTPPVVDVAAADVPLAVDTAATDLAPADVIVTLDTSIVDTGGVDGTAGTEVGRPDAAACTTFPKRFDSDTVVPKGCYLVESSPVIGAAVKLTLSPGVILMFSQNTGLSFSGNQVLIAAGTATEPILLTGLQTQRGFWNGISFDGTLLPDSVLDYVTIEYAGRTTSDKNAAAIKMTADSRGVRASITHSIVRESQGWGLWLGGSAVLGQFASNLLTKNTLGPASVSSEVVEMLDPASSYKGNDRDQLVVQTQYISGAATWAALDVPYYLTSGLHTSVDWTIAPGTTLIMGDGAELVISGDSGALIAAGTATQPILFTGATKAKGAWTGITFDGSNNTRNQLSYATVEYAGSTTSDRDAADVKMIADSHGVQVKMSSTTLRESQGWGLFVPASGVLPQFAGNLVTANRLGPVKIGSEAVQQLLPSSSYTGNDIDQVSVSANTVKQVTWVALDAPYVLNGGLDVAVPWTIASGVVLLMAPSAWISVGGDTGVLQAVGTASAPILISATVKTPGSWESITFDNTRQNANILDYCTVEYGGGGQAKGEMGMLIAQSDSRGVALTVTNSKVQHSSQYGIVLGHYAQSTLTGTTYADNKTGDVYQAP